MQLPFRKTIRSGGGSSSDIQGETEAVEPMMGAPPATQLTYV